MHTVSNIHSSGTEAEHACRIRILPRGQHAPLIATTTIVIQVNKNILSEKGGAHCQGFCRQIVYTGVKSKETSFIRRENVIVLNLAHLD